MQSLIGRFWIMKDGKNFLGDGRIQLLKNIHETGSISQAAKMMKMSYKAAWDDVDMMNNLADTPLVVKNTGGKQGGGTELTDRGTQLIYEYSQISQLFEQDLMGLQFLLAYTGKEIHFNNTFDAEIKKADRLSAVHTRLTLRTANGMILYATILTEYYKKYLKDSYCTAIIPPDNLTLAFSEQSIVKEHTLEGTILNSTKEGIYSFIETELSSGNKLTVRVIEECFKRSGLKKNTSIVLLYNSDDIYVTNGE